VGSFPRFHEDKGREISVNPVRKFGRGFKPLPHCIFSKFRPFGRRLLSNGVNISRITDLPTPKSPPKRGLSDSLGLKRRRSNVWYYHRKEKNKRPMCILQRQWQRPFWHYVVPLYVLRLWGKGNSHDFITV